MKKIFIYILFLSSLASAQTISGNYLNISGSGRVVGKLSMGNAYTNVLQMGGNRPYISLLGKDGYFELGNDAWLGSKTFTPGWQYGYGWKLAVADSEYTLTLDNLEVRGWIKTHEMILDQLKATYGDLLITSAGMVDSVSSDTTWFTTDDVTGHGVSPFWDNDIIMCQRVDMSGATFDANGNIDTTGYYNSASYLVKRLIYKVDSTVGLRVYFSDASGAPINVGIPKKGDAFVRIGNTDLSSGRNGSIGLYANQEYSPYIRVVDSVNSYSKWKDPDNVKVQLGRLDSLDTPIGKLFGYGLYTKRFYLVQNANNYISYDGNNFKIKIGGIAIDSITNGIDSVYTLFSQTDSTLALYATKIWVNSIANQVHSDSASIIVNANNISSNVSSISSLNGDVSTNISNISQNASNISLNVTSINKIDDSVSTHRSEINQNADNISLNVTAISNNAGNISTNSSGISINADSITLHTNGFIHLNGNTTVDGSFQLNGNALISGTVTADNVVANISITSPTITGGTYYTAESGKRIVINGANNNIGFFISGSGTGGTLVGAMEPDVTGSYVDMSGYYWFDAPLTCGSYVNAINGYKIDGSYLASDNLADWPSNSSGYLHNDGSGNLSWGNPGGSGTVTSVGLSMPTGFSTTGSPITTSGTLSVSFASGYSLLNTSGNYSGVSVGEATYADHLYDDMGSFSVSADQVGSSLSKSGGTIYLKSGNGTNISNITLTASDVGVSFGSSVGTIYVSNISGGSPTQACDLIPITINGTTYYGLSPQ